MEQWEWLTDPVELEHLLATHDGNAEALSRATGCPVGRIKRRRVKLGIKQISGKGVFEAAFEQITHTSMEQVRLSGDGTVTCDFHIPLTDWGLVDYMVGEAKRLKLTDWLVIAGDLFHMDALNRHDWKQADCKLPGELVDANAAMKLLLQTFDRIVVTLGNHDENAMRTLGYKLKFEHTLSLLLYDLTPDERARVVTTGIDAVMIDTPNGEWRACHTRSYSRQQLTVPAKLADRHRCHIIGAHRHHHAVGHSPSGYWVVEGGGFFDASRTDYLVRYTNDFPKWQNGWTFLVDGHPVCPMLNGPIRIER